MGKYDKYKHGDWNAICDVCGLKYKASMLRLTWDNLRSCPKCWEPRHPQDFVRGKADRQRVPWNRPDDDLQILSTTLAAAHTAGAVSLNVASIQSIVQYTPLIIACDGPDTVWHSCYVTSTPAVSTAVPINDPLPYAAASGNTVYIAGTGDDYLAVGDVTATDLETR